MTSIGLSPTTRPSVRSKPRKVTIQLLEAVSAEPVVRTRITDAIKVYERDVLREVTWQM
jgi:hypothetical protein